MGRSDETCFGCVPWSRRRSNSIPSTARATRGPVSAVKSPSLKGSSKAVRGIIKGAPDPAPVQWRSQVGISDNSSTSSERIGVGTDSESGIKSVGLSATAFPSDLEVTSPGARISARGFAACQPDQLSTPPRQLAVSPPPVRHSANGAKPGAREPASAVVPGNAFMGPHSTGPLDPASRLAELQQRYNRRAPAGDPGGPSAAAAAAAAAQVEERLPGDHMVCDSFSYHVNVHDAPRGALPARGANPLSAPLPPLPVGGPIGGGGVHGSSCSGGYEPRRPDQSSLAATSERRSAPFAHSSSAGVAVQPRLESMTTSIPGSLPSVTQPGPAYGFRPSRGTGVDLHARDPQVPRHHRLSAGPGGDGISPFPSAAAGIAAGAPKGPRADDADGGFSFPTAHWQPGGRPAVPASRAGTPRVGPVTPASHHTTHGPAGYNSALAVSPTQSQTRPGSRSRSPMGQLPVGRTAFGSETMEPGPAIGACLGGGGSSAGIRGAETSTIVTMAAMAALGGSSSLPPERFLARNSSSGVGRGCGGGLGGMAAPPMVLLAPSPPQEGPPPGAGSGAGNSGAPLLTAAGNRPDTPPGVTPAKAPSFASAFIEPQQEQFAPTTDQQQQQRQQQLQRTESLQSALAQGLAEDAGRQQVGQREDPQCSGEAPLQTGPVDTSAPPSRTSLERQPPLTNGLEVAAPAAPAAAEAAAGGSGAVRPPPPAGASPLAAGAANVSAGAASGLQEEFRPVTAAPPRMAGVRANEEMLAALLSGKGALQALHSSNGGGGGGAGGTADELERFDRVSDALTRLENILAGPPLVPPGRSLNARSGPTENAFKDFTGAAPPQPDQSVPVKPW